MKREVAGSAAVIDGWARDGARCDGVCAHFHRVGGVEKADEPRGAGAMNKVMLGSYVMVLAL